MRILEKTSFIKVRYRFGGNQNEDIYGSLRKGTPSIVRAVVEHLLFESSQSMIEKLKRHKINFDIRYMTPHKFYRQIQQTLLDLFNFRTTLSSDQFVGEGCAERKLLLIIDVYGLVKLCKRQARVTQRLTAHDVDFEYPEEMAQRGYEVHNHQNMVSSKMQFNRNAMMNRDQLTLKEKTELPEDSDKLDQGKKQNEDLQIDQSETTKQPTLPLVFYNKKKAGKEVSVKDDAEENLRNDKVGQDFAPHQSVMSIA